MLILFVISLLASLAAGQSHIGHWTTSDGANHDGVPGKYLMGVKVITISGRPLGLEPVFLRTVGRIIDVLPAFYLLGWFVMRRSGRPPQRLGDRLARTTVVPASHPA